MERPPLAPMNGSTVKFSSDTSSGESKKPSSTSSTPRINAGGDPSSFSVMSSGMPSAILAEQMIMRGAKRKPTMGQGITGFYNSITHLHLQGVRLMHDVVPVTCCKNLRVLNQDTPW